MSGGSRPRDNGRAGASRHIRSVAEHFLGAGPPGLSSAPAAGPAPPAARAEADGGAALGRGYSFGVAAASDGWLAARVSVGLARCTLPGAGGGRAVAPGPFLQVWLDDRHSGPWLAWPLLGQGSGVRQPPQGGPEPGRALAAGRAGLVGESPLPAAPPAARGGPGRAAPAVAVRWLNLGCVDEAALGRWERAAPGPAGGDGGDGLVWCLRAAEAGRLAAAYRLGRLLQALAPAQLKLLVFPDVRLADGPPPGGEAAARAPDAAELETAVCLARARAAPVVPAGCVWEALAAPLARCGDDGAGLAGPGEAGPGAAGRRIYAPLAASLEQGAAARRRVSSPAGLARAASE